MANTTSTLVKAALRIPAGVTFHDARVTSCVTAANDYVLRALRQTSLAVTTATEYAAVYGNAQRQIILRRYPVVGIAVITEDGTALAASSYRYDAENAILYKAPSAAYWSSEPDGVLVHYGAGYDAGTLPDELVEAATLIAASLFNRAVLQGLESVDDGSTDVKVSKDVLPMEARLILNRYRSLTP